MSTVAQVINRLYREYLYPASDQPTRALLNTSITAVETTVVFNLTGLLTPEELDLLGEGVVIEIDQEWMLVTAWASPNATVTRAWGGTSGVAHTAGAVIYLAPMFSRLAVFNAVADAIVDLYPELYAVKRREYTTATAPIEIDVSAVEVQRFRWEDEALRLHPGTLEFVDDYGSPKIQLGSDVPIGYNSYLTYFSKFPRPTKESDDLGDDLGDWVIPDEWVKIIMVDALATLIGSRQADSINTDFIVEMLVREGFDTQASRSVISSMLALRNEWVTRAQNRQRMTTNIRIEMKK